MKNFETRSAITLLLALGMALGTTSSFAEGDASSAAQAADAGKEAPTQQQTPTLDSSYGLGGNTVGVFDSGIDNTGIGSRAVSPNYQMGGYGIATSGRPAAEGDIMTSPARGRPIRFDNGIFVYPAVTLAYGYNDNVRGVATNKNSSGIFVLRPEVTAELRNQGDRYTFNYTGNYGQYQSSPNDDFYNHELWFAGDNYFTTRARMGWGVGYIERTDPRGATDRVASDRPDRWHAPIARFLGVYGAQGAVGKIELEGVMMQKRYDNNRQYTYGSDVDLTSIAGRFQYRFMPKTAALIELRNTWANYTWSGSIQDNTDTRVYAGLIWDATAKTTGTVKLGRAYKRFDTVTSQDHDSTSWEAAINWSPLTYSKFNLTASRAPIDSTGGGASVIMNNATNLVWTHNWASYITSRVSAGLYKADYINGNREDKTKFYSVGFFHEIGYRARVGIDWNHTDRNSNQDVYDFKRNVTMLSLELVL